MIKPEDFYGEIDLISLKYGKARALELAGVIKDAQTMEMRLIGNPDLVIKEIYMVLREFNTGNKMDLSINTIYKITALVYNYLQQIDSDIYFTQPPSP